MNAYNHPLLCNQAALVAVTLTLILGAGTTFALTNSAPAKATVKAFPLAPKPHPAPAAKALAHPPATGVPAAGAIPEDIRDIRGPRHIPSPWLWAVWTAAGLSALALGFAAWRWWHRRALAKAKLPFEIALDRLEEARAFLKPETAREFSIAVSEIVRGYVEDRFAVHAARRTTEEFLHDLLEPSDALLTNHRELLGDFLQHCDLAKFARWILSTEEMEQMHRSARTFVLETAVASAHTAPSVATESAPTATPTPAIRLNKPAHANS